MVPQTDTNLYSLHAGKDRQIYHLTFGSTVILFRSRILSQLRRISSPVPTQWIIPSLPKQGLMKTFLKNKGQKSKIFKATRVAALFGPAYEQNRQALTKPGGVSWEIFYLFSSVGFLHCVLSAQYVYWLLVHSFCTVLNFWKGLVLVFGNLSHNCKTTWNLYRKQ